MMLQNIDRKRLGQDGLSPFPNPHQATVIK
jgi:hypothetical protein